MGYLFMQQGHRTKVRRHHAALFTAQVAAVLLVASPLHAAPKTFGCSPYTPDANLNEIVLQGTGQLTVKFIETKILSDLGANRIRHVDQDPDHQWQLCMTKTTAPQNHPCNNALRSYSTSEIDCYHYGVREFRHNLGNEAICDDDARANPFDDGDYLSKELNFSGNQFEAIILDGPYADPSTKAIDYIRVCKNGCQQSQLLWLTDGSLPGGSGESTGTGQCGNQLVYGSATGDVPIIFARLTDGNGPWLGSLNEDGTVNPYGPTEPTQGKPNEEEPPPPSIDHIAIYHDGQALTCAPEEVTIYACLNADCSSLYTGSITVDLSPAGWSSDPVTFSGGSTTLSLRRTAAGTVTLAATATTPAAVNSTRCFLLSGGESCAMSFYKAGFIFDVPTLTANKASAPITISAVKSTGTTCGPAFEGTRNVSFWSTYSNPDAGTKKVKVSGDEVATASPGTPVSLTFNSDAQAQITVHYPDAGLIQLDAKFEGTGSESGLDMIGNDQFVVKPAGLCVESPDANADCAAGDHTCSAFVKAGETFNLNVTAVAWEVDSDPDLCSSGNQITPNFRHTGIALVHSLVAPIGGQLGSLGVDSFDFVANDNGTKTISTQTVSEVGVFRFTATPPNSAYFSETAPGGTSAYIGRFTPHHLAFSGSLLGTTCPFTYMEEPFNLSLDIEAQNLNNVKTFNYTGGFAKLDPATASWDTLGSSNSLGVGAVHATTPLSNRLALIAGSPAGTWTNGAATLTANFTFSRPITPTPDTTWGPYESLLIGAAPRDADGVTVLASDLNLDADGITGNERRTIGSTNMRYGRLKVFTNFGPENENITGSPFAAQYYNGGAWVTNSDDDCTTGVSFCPAGRTQNIAPATLADGRGTMTVTAGFSGEHLDVCAVTPTWLTSGNCTTPGEGCGQITFGIYRGNDRIINWQEVQR